MDEINMTIRNSVAIVEDFWRQVWQRPQNPEVIDELVSRRLHSDLGWDRNSLTRRLQSLGEEFLGAGAGIRVPHRGDIQNQDDTRVASRWRVTGRNAGLMGTPPNGVPFEMTGTR
jgi:hypothetical protein